VENGTNFLSRKRCPVFSNSNAQCGDPETIPVLVRDQAGFASLRSPLRGSLRLAVSLRSAHLRDGDPRLPELVRIVDLSPYSPELNPCEQMWDIVKDDTSNQV